VAKLQLTRPERKFLSRVSRAVFANPFSDERFAADSEIIDIDPSASYEERTKKIIHVVIDRIDSLTKEGKDDIRKFSGKDRSLIENGFLFNIYLRFYPYFDRLIQEQIQAGETPCRISFADDAISMILQRGFSKEEALHYFSTFFQMRRAFYFIRKSIIGKSPCMKELRLNLWNNVFTCDIELYARYLWNRMEDYSTLLLGETGTGKGIAAVAIGRSGYIPYDEKKSCFSESFTRAFVSLNLSQFPEQLIESELFGHKKGAFTGAVADHEGIFSRCSPHGAIFLDEIGEVSIPVQIKLLQVLQDRVFSPVGSHGNHRFHGRVIAATNRSLRTLRTEAVFRDDFFYRLCSDIITVPPLPQRIQEEPEELDDLIDHALTGIVGKPSPELGEKVKEVIQKQIPRGYPWPGNVRELEQCIRRILLKHTYRVDTMEKGSREFIETFLSGLQEGAMNARQVLSGYCRILYGRYGTYEEVARRTGLDRRTVKKYLELFNRGEES
jgi:DNA-binding NtrC family response regulator